MIERASFFISYRRDDSSGHVGRLYDVLSARFGASQIFVDIDHIGPGEDFVRALDAAVAKSLVMLVVIGKRWVKDESGYSRLQTPNDWVRLEVVAALQRGIRVIPILVQGVQMPSPRDLPYDLRELSTRNAFELSDLRWKEDVQRLIAELDRLSAAAYKEAVAAARVAAAAAKEKAASVKGVTASIQQSELSDGAPARSARRRLPRWMWVAALVLFVTGSVYVRAKLRAASASPSGQFSLPTGDPPPPPEKIAENGASAKDDARRWRNDAVLTLVTVQQAPGAAPTSPFGVSYSFVSPQDGRVLTVIDAPNGRSYYPAPQPYRGRFYSIPNPFMDLSEALSIAQRSGMRSPLGRAFLYWHTPANRPTVLVWTIVPTSQNGGAAGYNINAQTGVLIPIPQLIE